MTEKEKDTIVRFINWIAFILLTLPFTCTAAPDNTQLEVWANEAIVATYTFDYKNYLAQQRAIAHYFTANGWTQYSDALNASKLPETVQKNAYFVSAVATLPPVIKALGEKQWQATMPLLVLYKNPQYQQKQTLQVTIQFGETPSGQGVRGLGISHLQAKISEPACICQPVENTNATTSGTPPNPSGKK